jgi:hypothetical protein
MRTAGGLEGLLPVAGHHHRETLGLQSVLETAGHRRFVFDLQVCRGLDSTFMGCIKIGRAHV